MDKTGRRDFLKRMAAVSSVALPFMQKQGAASVIEKSRPNIVLFLADDMGHGHVGCMNPRAKISTPRLDRLASQGISFGDAHSGSGVCSPTRYGLLTGRYAWRTRLVSGVLGPYDPPLIEKDRLTLPAMLRQHGYRTACIGKWHLGWQWPREGGNDPDFSRPIADGPTARGFDYYFGTDVPNYPPYCFIENDRTVGQPTARKTERTLDGRPGPMLPGWQFDRILPTLAERAERWIADCAGAKQPFFLFFSSTAPHEPIAPSQEFRGKSGLNPLADFLIETDATVGRVLDALDRHGLTENTLFIFTGDNGSSLYTGARELQKAGHEPSAQFRGAKADIYEGGHRVPFFARWPGRIEAGSRSDETICLTDMIATYAGLIGAALPENAAEDSFDISPALLGRKYERPIREATVHQSSAGQLAIRQGPWKFIAPAPARGKTPAAPAELYNLAQDPSEKANLYKRNREVADRLAALLEKYRKDGRSAPGVKRL